MLDVPKHSPAESKIIPFYLIFTKDILAPCQQMSTLQPETKKPLHNQTSGEGLDSSFSELPRVRGPSRVLLYWSSPHGVRGSPPCDDMSGKKAVIVICVNAPSVCFHRLLPGPPLRTTRHYHALWPGSSCGLPGCQTMGSNQRMSC